jgi:hypothetical protein
MERLFHRAIKLFLSAIEAAKLFTSRRAAMLQQPFSIACHSRWWFLLLTERLGSGAQFFLELLPFLRCQPVFH